MQVQVALTERMCRLAVSGEQWDGQSFRRVSDSNAAPVPVFPKLRLLESVLVVDSATVRVFMGARLAPFRFGVDFAQSGEIAIDMAQARTYTCVFLDILMPGIDGYQVCKRVKSNRTTEDMVGVMVSSKASAFDRSRGNRAAGEAYLTKPVSENELLATIARFLPSARRSAHEILESVQ